MMSRRKYIILQMFSLTRDAWQELSLAEEERHGRHHSPHNPSSSPIMMIITLWSLGFFRILLSLSFNLINHFFGICFFSRIFLHITLSSLGFSGPTQVSTLSSLNSYFESAFTLAFSSVKASLLSLLVSSLFIIRSVPCIIHKLSGITNTHIFLLINLVHTLNHC